MKTQRDYKDVETMEEVLALVSVKASDVCGLLVPYVEQKPERQFYTEDFSNDAFWLEDLVALMKRAAVLLLDEPIEREALALKTQVAAYLHDNPDILNRAGVGELLYRLLAGEWIAAVLIVRTTPLHWSSDIHATADRLGGLLNRRGGG